MTTLLTTDKEQWLKSCIRDIPDFPKPGIVFKDLTTLLRDAEAFSFVIDVLAEHFGKLKPDFIAGIEARGFIMGPVIAHKIGAGFIPIRKPGKLPYKVEKACYELEYGSDCLEVHLDAARAGDRVAVIDDLLATGGTAAAALELINKLQADIVSIGFVVELGFLNGRERLPNTDVFSIIKY